MRDRKTVTVMLAFECEVEGDVDAGVVGQNLCELIQAPGQIGNPDWIATPRTVGFIRATDNGASDEGRDA